MSTSTTKTWPSTPLRCTKCNKLLARAPAHDCLVEIKCTRCGAFNSFLEGHRDQVIITDPEGRILFVNEQVIENTQYTVDEILGQTPRLWGAQMDPEFYRELWHTIKHQKQSALVTVTNKRKDGTLYKARLRISPVMGSTGEIEFFVGIETTLSH